MVPTLLATAACGNSAGGGGSVSPPAPLPTTQPTSTPSPTSTPGVDGAPCVAGTWTARGSGKPIGLETAHFAVRWDGQTLTAATAEVLGTKLENIFDVYTKTVGFPEPYCGATAKTKFNVYIDPSYGSTGSLDGEGIPSFWGEPNIVNRDEVLAHELAHAFQGGSGGLQDSPYTGWFWESHAEWMASQMPALRGKFTGCAQNSVLYPHFVYGYSPLRYCNWQLIEYLKDKYGYAAVNAIWTKSPRPGTSERVNVDVLSVIMKNMNWSVSQMNDFFGEWALHNVNWDYTNPDGTDQGAVYRAAFGSNDDNAEYRRLRTATLDPINLQTRRFAIPFSQAPQRFGYNLVKLYPDSGSNQISVNFRGAVQTAAATTSLPGLANEPSSIPAPASGWRYGLVAVDANGKSRYSAVGSSATGNASIDVRSGDKSFWLVVVGAPTENLRTVWFQAYYSLYRYPWSVQFTGAMPSGFQPGAPNPTAQGRRHPNGGGWVAAGAVVADTAYVGPYATVLGGSVLGNARIEDHAVVESGVVRDRAVVGGLSLISENSTISDDARVATVFEGIRASQVTGTAQNLGDTNYYRYKVSKGVQYGMYETQDQLLATDRGAALTAAVPEVTARPDHGN
jgi:hypothetical protein